MAKGIASLLSALEAQHYGPQDSMIASAIMHPNEGISKFSQWLQDSVKQASNAPIIPYSDIPQASESSKAALNLAGLLQTGGIPFGPKSKGGILGTILAPGRADLSYEKARDAQYYLLKGKGYKDFWDKYKLYPWKDPSGNGVVLGEISDPVNFYKPKGDYIPREGKLKDLIEHDELFKAYPSLADLDVKVGDGNFYSLKGNYIQLDKSLKGLDVDKKLLHEIQHKIQTDRFLSPGTSVDYEFKKLTNKYLADNGLANKHLRPTMKDAYEAYRNNAGEAQARMAEERFGYKNNDISPLDTLLQMGYPFEKLNWND